MLSSARSAAAQSVAAVANAAAAARRQSRVVIGSVLQLLGSQQRSGLRVGARRLTRRRGKQAAPALRADGAGNDLALVRRAEMYAAAALPFPTRPVLVTDGRLGNLHLGGRLGRE